MAEKRDTLHRILTELNKMEPAGYPVWLPLEGVFSSAQVKIDSPTQSVVNLENALIFKFIINIKTGEIKSYLAKWLSDVPETKDLP
ncbi:MAG: hypothetical protein V4509_05130 [Patescibacteria group bacterium]